MSQKIIYGIDQVENLIGDKKFLLVRDGAYEYLPVKEIFDRHPHAEFSDFTPNPLYEQVCAGVEVFHQTGCEMIVAVGGGSTIDVAKCIKLYCKMDKSINYLKQEMSDTQVPLAAVPTTAGTGSESTRHAVIYFEGAKQSISHPSIVPNYAVLEPSVLKTLPVYQKKCTMMDALCQAIESWWSVNSTDESKEYSKQAIDLIKSNWEEYIFENTDGAAAKIMQAANLAGRAIDITATTAAHAMSYKITSMYKLPHGYAVAICLPKVWAYMIAHTENCSDPRGSSYLKSTLNEISDRVDLDYFEMMLEKLEMTGPEGEKEDLDLLTRSVNPVRLKNNPVTLDTQTLNEMYREIVR